MDIPGDAPMVQNAINQYQSKIDNIVDTEIRWNEDKQLMIIDTMTHFPMPTDDGGTYWESEVASHEELTWNEFTLKSMLQTQM